MPSNWSKGFTKENNSSVRKISETMKRKRIDNFREWRERMKKEGKMISSYPEFKKDGNLAELIGVTLGDGHLCVYPRTEELRIISNSKNHGFVKRYESIIYKVFNKKPYIFFSKRDNSTRIGIYQKNISIRMGIPTGNRANLRVKVPSWILSEKRYILRYLRGLYEAEGAHCVHKPTCTYKFFFSNKNDYLLDIVFTLMSKIGFHPHKSKYQVQISRKEEVYAAMKVLGFRDYNK